MAFGKGRGGAPKKPALAALAVALAVDEATMRGWYAETWYGRADPADRFAGEAQLEYLRAKALDCRHAADSYDLTGKDRWFALMRCLVIVRKE